jgi:hypothetical protein
MQNLRRDVVTEARTAELHPFECGCEELLIVPPIQFPRIVCSVSALGEKYVAVSDVVHRVSGNFHKLNV